MPKAIMNATMHDTAMLPHATSPLNISFRRRPPISQLIRAPSSGAKMIMLKRLFSVITILVVQTYRHLDHRFAEPRPREKLSGMLVLGRNRKDKLFGTECSAVLFGRIDQCLAGTDPAGRFIDVKIMQPR